MKRIIYISRAITSTLLALLIILSPIIILASVVLCTPSQYDNAFVGALDEKYERLTGLDGEKLIVVGGSSVAFGIESDILEKYIQMPVVNFGLYAALGTKLMLDLSRDGIGEGDIVVLAPELNAQTLSLYFNAETTWQAIDGNLSMFCSITPDHHFSMLGTSFKYASNKLNYLLSGKENPAGVYNGNNFDECGDLEYEREQNIMPMYYDPSNTVYLAEEIVEGSFIDYLNDYIAYCKAAGAEVYFSYCPMNENGIRAGSDAQAFEKYLKKSIDCPIISDIEDYIYEAGYFYDTNYHLNDAGVIAHSVNLTRDLLLELGIPTRVDVEVPEAPELPEADVKWFGEDENVKYFEFEANTDGSYTIVGLTELGKTQTVLTVPLGYDGFKVTVIGAGAFKGGDVKTLILPKDTNISVISDGAFSDASTLSALVIDMLNAEEILPPASFSGVSAGFAVYVPESSNFTSDYYWAHRRLTFKDIKEIINE